MIDYKIYSSTKELPSDWNSLAKHDVFLQSQYLKALEDSSPKNISWFYLGIFESEQLVAIAIIQRVELYLEDIFRNYKDSHFRQKFKYFVSKFLRGNMLVIGNLMHTGQHGFYFDADKITQSKFLQTTFSALVQLKHIIRRENRKRIRIIVFKDYFTDDAIHKETSFFKSHKLHKLTVQPNMIMDIDANWNTFDDYYSDINKKYKQRYKAARKKAVRIVKKEMSIMEIELHCDQLYEFYRTVSDNSRINTFILPKGHFCELKRQLGQNFKVFGYYLDDILIAFYTLILNNGTLETYFLGYDEKDQSTNQLYLNMLYDMLEFGISNKFHSIVFARTAMEIKSSVGAKPIEMNLYLKHTNSLMNYALNRIFNLMNPAQQWEERHPFR